MGDINEWNVVRERNTHLKEKKKIRLNISEIYLQILENLSWRLRYIYFVLFQPADLEQMNRNYREANVN